MVSDNQMFIIMSITILLREPNTAFPLAMLLEICFQGVRALPHSSLLEEQGCRIKPYCDFRMQNRQKKRFLLFCSSCLHLCQWTWEIKSQYALKEICPDYHCIMINFILCMSPNTLELNEKTDPGNVLRHQYYCSNSNFPLLPRTFLRLWNTENPWLYLPLKKIVPSPLNFIIFLRFWTEQAFACTLLKSRSWCKPVPQIRKVCLALSDFRANPVPIGIALSVSEFPLSHAFIFVSVFCPGHTTGMIKHLFWVHPFNWNKLMCSTEIGPVPTGILTADFSLVKAKSKMKEC